MSPRTSDRLRGRSDEAVVEGEAEGLDYWRRAMDAPHQLDFAVMRRLLLDLDAFFLEHRLCGDLDGDATDEHVWLACVACGRGSSERWGRDVGACLGC